MKSYTEQQMRSAITKSGIIDEEKINKIIGSFSPINTVNLENYSLSELHDLQDEILKRHTPETGTQIVNLKDAINLDNYSVEELREFSYEILRYTKNIK